MNGGRSTQRHGDSGTNTLTVEDLDAIRREVLSVVRVDPYGKRKVPPVFGNMNWNNIWSRA